MDGPCKSNRNVRPSHRFLKGNGKDQFRKEGGKDLAGRLSRSPFYRADILPFLRLDRRSETRQERIVPLQIQWRPWLGCLSHRRRPVSKGPIFLISTSLCSSETELNHQDETSWASQGSSSPRSRSACASSSLPGQESPDPTRACRDETGRYLLRPNLQKKFFHLSCLLSVSPQKNHCWQFNNAKLAIKIFFSFVANCQYSVDIANC